MQTTALHLCLAVAPELTLERCWAWDLVITVHVVDVDLDTGIGGRVCAGEGHGVGALVRSASSDPDLSTFHVELCFSDCRGAVQSEQFDAHKVITRGDAGGLCRKSVQIA